MARKGKQRRAARNERKQTKRAGKTARKSARVNKRTNASINRTNKRAAGSARRVAKRGAGRDRRIEGRAKKAEARYGKLHPRVAEAVEDLAPLQDVMVEDLQEQGVYVSDPEDTIEVASKWTEYNDEIEDDIEESTLEDAYGNEELDEEEGVENFDRSNIRKGAMEFLKGGMGAVGTNVSNYIDQIAKKKEAGGDLTENEKKLLNAANKTKEVIKDKVVSDITDTLKDFAPILITAAILGIIIYKFG